jgi:transcriptional regulator with XRE-family HTH domain
MNYQRRTAVAAGEVRALLGRNRQSIADLSAATGIPLSTLNRRLLVKAPFTIDELDIIARHFDVPMSTLLTAPPRSEVAS